MSNPKDLQPLVQRVAGRLRERPVNVAVVGDIILDNAIEGVCGGVHPETDVPVLREATAQESIGGAANIALGLARLGAQATIYGIVGADLAGRQLRNLLDRQSFAVHLAVEPGWPTPRKDWIYERQGQRALLRQRIDYDRPLSAHAREELVGEFRARGTGNIDAMIIADHGLGSIGSESLALITLAKERGIRIVAIPRSTILRGQPVDAIVLNASELRNLVNAAPDADPEPLAALYAREHAQHVFLSLLGKGIRVCPAGTTSVATLCSGYPLDSPKWMGARDITTALVAVGLALGLEPVETGRLATVFRHLVASQRGNGCVQWRDVFRFVGLPEN